MALYLNATAAAITIRARNKEKGGIWYSGKSITFNPGMMTEVSDADVAAFKKVPLFVRSLDKEHIITGSRARRIGEETAAELGIPSNQDDGSGLVEPPEAGGKEPSPEPPVVGAPPVPPAPQPQAPTAGGPVPPMPPA